MRYYSDCFLIGKNPSSIGGGFTVFNEKNEKIFSEKILRPGFTNNEGELRGILKALQVAENEDTVITDSMCCLHWVRSGNPKSRPDLKFLAQEAHDLEIVKMKWKNLFSNKCPKCSCSIEYKRDSQLFECALYDEPSDQSQGFFSCDFSISPQKLDALKGSIKSGQMLNEYNTSNGERLNNLRL